MIRRSLVLWVALFFPLLPTTSLNAEDYSGQLEIGIQGGKAVFEGGSEIRDNETIGGRLGYNVTEHIGIEGSFFTSDTEAEITETDMDVDFFGLEALFHANRKQRRYFLAAGLGLMNVQRQVLNDTSDSTLNWGGGAKFHIWNGLHGRLDLRHIINIDRGQNDSVGLALVGLFWHFNWLGEDSDGDGVRDPIDDCPDTPPHVGVNRRGCPLDSDKDGITDDIDQCPKTHPGARINNQGCADEDQDGIADLKDKCLKTHYGVSVNKEGCGDRDGDGLLDDVDQCINRPETINGFEDEDGCPDKKPIPKKKTWTLEGVNFKSGSAKITEKSLPTLRESWLILRDNIEIRIEIQGHTDSVGSAASNKSLSLKRAQAVKEFMVKRGIIPQRMTVVGYGEENPIESNNTKAGRAKNRRIEIKIID